MSFNPPPVSPIYMHWGTTSLTREDCQLACALRIYIKFEDGTDLDDTTIGEVIGYHKTPGDLKRTHVPGHRNNVQPVDCTGLVDYLQQTDNLYQQVLANGVGMAPWARDIWNLWQDDEAAPVGTWP